MAGYEEDFENILTGTYNPQTTSVIEEEANPAWENDFKLILESANPYETQLKGLPLGMGDQIQKFIDNPGQFSKAEVQGAVDWIQKNNFEGGVDYTTDYADPLTKFKFGLNDTDEEKEAFLDQEFGSGNWRMDKGGRYIIKDQSGKETVFNAPGFTPSDLAGAPNEILSSLGATIGAFAGGGLGLGGRLATEFAGGMAGYTAGEGLESYLGYNKEEFNEIVGRGKWEAVIQGAFTLGSAVPAFIASKIKNPLGGGVTLDSKAITNDLQEWNNARIARGESAITLRASALNEAPVLNRIEGILSKMPGSSGVYQRLQRDFQQAVEDEIKFLTKDSDDREVLATKLRDTFKSSVDAKINAERSIKNARFTGVDRITGGKALIDGSERALSDFKDVAEATERRLYTMIGNPNVRVIDIKGLKDTARKLINQIPRTATGEPVELFNPGQSVKALQQFLEMPDSVTFETARHMRTALGDLIGGRQSDAISTVSSGQAKLLYGKISESLKDAPGIAKRAGLTGDAAKQFVQEFSLYNKWYAEKHDIFNNTKSPINRIITSYHPDELANYFFSTENASNINLIKKTIPPDKFKIFQESAQDLLLTNKDGKQLVAAIKGLGDDVMEATFGKQKTQDLKEFAQAAELLQNTPLSKFVLDERPLEDLMNQGIKPNSPSTVTDMKRFLGPKSDEWKEFQVYFASKLMREALDVNRTLDGNKLLNKINRHYGDDVVGKVFEGTPLKENLERLAKLSIAERKSEKSMAGGLMAGGFIAGMAVMGLPQAATVMIGTNVAARALASNTAKSWLTNEPLSQMGSSTIRAATHTMANMSRSPLRETEGPQYQSSDIDPDKVLRQWFEITRDSETLQ